MQNIENPVEIDKFWMKRCLALAGQAAAVGEVPVGALIIDASDSILAEGYNGSISKKDPTAHAEIEVIRAAAKKTGNYRLPQTTLYVTIEPCIMCFGAMIHARIGRLVYGAPEPKSGALMSRFDLREKGGFNHNIVVSNGCMEFECAKIISDFFRQKRATKSV